MQKGVQLSTQLGYQGLVRTTFAYMAVRTIFAYMAVIIIFAYMAVRTIFAYIAVRPYLHTWRKN